MIYNNFYFSDAWNNLYEQYLTLYNQNQLLND